MKKPLTCPLSSYLLFYLDHRTDIFLDECNMDPDLNLNSHLTLLTSESEENYIRYFIRGKQLRAATFEVYIFVKHLIFCSSSNFKSAVRETESAKSFALSKNLMWHDQILFEQHLSEKKKRSWLHEHTDLLRFITWWCWMIINFMVVGFYIWLWKWNQH